MEDSHKKHVNELLLLARRRSNLVLCGYPNGKIQNFRVIKKCFLGGNVPWVQLLTDGFRIWNRRLLRPPGG